MGSHTWTPSKESIRREHSPPNSQITMLSLLIALFRSPSNGVESILKAALKKIVLCFSLELPSPCAVNCSMNWGQ